MIAVALVLALSASAAVAPSGPPTSTGTGGAAASVETLATQAAIDTLNAGGNAVDAAVAAAGVLGVTEPFSCGVGGGGFMVIRTAGGKVTTIDGRETAPATMTPTSFWSRRRAAAVQRRALERAVRRRPRHARDLGGRARELRHDLARAGAAGGHPRRARTASSSTRRSSTRRRRRSRGSTTSRRRPRSILDPDGTPHDVGTIFRNPDLAQHVRAHRAARREGPLPRPDRRRDRRPRCSIPSSRRRRPRLAARRDDDARPARPTPRPSGRRRT